MKLLHNILWLKVFLDSAHRERYTVIYYYGQGQSRRWHIGDWFLAYRVLRGFSRGSHVSNPIRRGPRLKFDRLSSECRVIFRPSFMYETDNNPLDYWNPRIDWSTATDIRNCSGRTRTSTNWYDSVRVAFRPLRKLPLVFSVLAQLWNPRV